MNDANNKLEETKEAVDGGLGSYEASGAFNNDGPMLVDEVSMGGNHVRHAKPVERLMYIVRCVVDHWVEYRLGWCGVNFSTFSRFYWDYFSVSTLLRTAALIWGSDVVHCVRLSSSGTACSCLRAYGIE